MMISPPRPTAKMSARLPSGRGISSSTECPDWRISRQAPRQTARVISGRAWRATNGMLMGIEPKARPCSTARRRPGLEVERALERRCELLRQRFGRAPILLRDLLAGLFPRGARVGMAAALGEQQPLVTLDRIDRAGDTADRHETERVLRLRQSLLRGTAVPEHGLRRVPRNAHAREERIGELELG